MIIEVFFALFILAFLLAIASFSTFDRNPFAAIVIGFFATTFLIYAGMGAFNIEKAYPTTVNYTCNTLDTSGNSSVCTDSTTTNSYTLVEYDRNTTLATVLIMLGVIMALLTFLAIWQWLKQEAL